MNGMFKINERNALSFSVYQRFYLKLGAVYEVLGTLNSTELQTEVSNLIDEIFSKLLL